MHRTGLNLTAVSSVVGADATGQAGQALSIPKQTRYRVGSTGGATLEPVPGGKSFPGALAEAGPSYPRAETA